MTDIIVNPDWLAAQMGDKAEEFLEFIEKHFLVG